MKPISPNHSRAAVRNLGRLEKLRAANDRAKQQLQAMEMKREGCSHAEIGKALGVSTGIVGRLLKDGGTP